MGEWIYIQLRCVKIDKILKGDSSLRLFFYSCLWGKLFSVSFFQQRNRYFVFGKWSIIFRPSSRYHCVTFAETFWLELSSHDWLTFVTGPDKTCRSVVICNTICTLHSNPIRCSHFCFDFNSSICAKIMAYSFVQRQCDFYHPPLSHTTQRMCCMSIVHSISSTCELAAQTERNLCHL